MTEYCPICGGNLKNDNSITGLINCEYCGKYKLEYDFQTNDIKNISQQEKNILKHIFQTLPSKSDYRYTFLNKDNLKEFLSIANSPATLIDKIHRILGYYADETKYYGEQILVEIEKSSRFHFCNDRNEFMSILGVLKDKKYIQYGAANPTVAKDAIMINVTIEGLDYFEKNILQSLKNNQCFVAMWFNDKENLENGEFNMSKVYTEAIEPAIQNEERNNKIKAVKINDLNYNSDVVDEIISQIRRSKFVVVDLTGNRGGVYYEAGFAEGIGLQVIYTCNSEWLMGNKEKNIPPVHFDTNHKNIIEWQYDNLEDFRKKLKKRINATIV